MKLQEKAIDRLKDLGVTEGLWLVEVSDYETAKQYYSARHIDDLTQFDEPEDNHIIYYHESGSIEQHSCFNADNEDSFLESVNHIAKYLGGEVRRCKSCNSFKIDTSQIVEGNQVDDFYNCKDCGFNWQECKNGINLLI